MIDIDSFIATLGPDLVHEGRHHWSSPIAAAVNYPTDEHRISADIEEHSFWFAHRNRCVVSMVRRFPPDGPLLDIGGGNGIVSVALKAASQLPIVMEPRAHAARVAGERGLPVIEAEFQSTRLAESLLPAAALFDVLEHIEDARGTLLALKRALRPGGRLYLTVPAHQWLWSRADEEACHVRRYRADELTQLLEGAGFRLEFSTFMFGPLVLPILLMRTIPWMAGLKHWPGRSSQVDHAPPSGAVTRFINARLDAEYASISQGSSSSFGSSIMVAARLPVQGQQ
jgi:SAM-dependent methyltransferase